LPAYTLLTVSAKTRANFTPIWTVAAPATGWGGTDLSAFSGRVSDSGEGRWTVLAAVDVGVPATVLSAALFERFA
jgi:6-phosphogluconate dehydrogenase